jgi:hypothetical protein
MAVTRFSNSNFTTGNKKFASFDTGYPSLMAAPTATDSGTGDTVSVAFTAQTGATSYTAISSPGSFTGSGVSSPVAVSGLTAGTAYTFQIRANNSVGSGPYSAASNSVTPIDPSGWEALSTTSFTSGTSVNINSINQTYGHLAIHYWVKFNGSANLDLQINGQTSNDYRTFVYYPAASAGGNYFSPYTAMRLNGSYESPNATQVLGGTIYIINYTDTTKYKSILNYPGSAGNSNGDSGIYVGYYPTTSAISSLTFNATAGAFVDGRISVYGIPV